MSLESNLRWLLEQSEKDSQSGNSQKENEGMSPKCDFLASLCEILIEACQNNQLTKIQYNGDNKSGALYLSDGNVRVMISTQQVEECEENV